LYLGVKIFPYLPSHNSKSDFGLKVKDNGISVSENGKIILRHFG